MCEDFKCHKFSMERRTLNVGKNLSKRVKFCQDLEQREGPLYIRHMASVTYYNNLV